MCQARKVEIETTKAVPMQVDSCGIMPIIIIIMWHHPHSKCIDVPGSLLECR